MASEDKEKRFSFISGHFVAPSVWWQMVVEAALDRFCSNDDWFYCDKNENLILRVMMLHVESANEVVIVRFYTWTADRVWFLRHVHLKLRAHNTNRCFLLSMCASLCLERSSADVKGRSSHEALQQRSVELSSAVPLGRVFLCQINLKCFTVQL